MNIKFSTVLLFFAVVLANCAPLSASAELPFAGIQKPHYHIAKKISIPGTGFWDYMYCDGRDHLLFISHGTHVQVLDTNSYKLVGDILHTDGVHGIAIDHKDGRGFTSNGRSNSVTIFNLKTFKTIAEVPVGNGPDAIVYEPKTDRVFTFNGQAQTSTAIDAKTGQVVGTIALGGRPEFAAVDGHGGLFNNIESTSEVVSIDPQTLQIIKRWSLAPAQSPSGISADPNAPLIFSVCHNGKMAISDTQTGTVVTTLPIGIGPDASCFDPATHLAFSSNGQSATLTVVRSNPDGSFAVVQNAKTMRGARTMALNLKTHDVYLVTAKFGKPPKGAAGFRRFVVIPNSFTLIVLKP